MMPTRRVLKSVLHGFLGTYTSRYSDYDGYWLFGFLVGDLDRAEFDLLAASPTKPGGPITTARELAVRRFAEQLEKHGIDERVVQDARLLMSRLPDDNSVPGQHFRPGYIISFSAIAMADTGRRFERDALVFVAPHDPRLESRSSIEHRDSNSPT